MHNHNTHLFENIIFTKTIFKNPNHRIPKKYLIPQLVIHFPQLNALMNVFIYKNVIRNYNKAMWQILLFDTVGRYNDLTAWFAEISCYCRLDEHICFITTLFQLSGDKTHSEVDGDLTPLCLWSVSRASLNDVITWRCSFWGSLNTPRWDIDPTWAINGPGLFRGDVRNR